MACSLPVVLMTLFLSGILRLVSETVEYLCIKYFVHHVNIILFPFCRLQCYNYSIIVMDYLIIFQSKTPVFLYSRTLHMVMNT